MLNVYALVLSAVAVVGLFALYRFKRRLTLPSNRKCSNCKNFDLPRGQAELDLQPAFKAAANILPPHLMGRKADLPLGDPHKDGTTPQLPDGAPSEAMSVDKDARPTTPEVPAKPRARLPVMQWQHFGACLTHNNLRWNGDSCKDWQ